MPLKKADATAQKNILADCIAVLMATGGTTTITRAQYDMMSSVNGERTASSFEHQFRHIIAKSKELKQRLDNGENFTPVPPAKKGYGNSAPVTPGKRKSADQKETPNKKATPKSSRAKQAAQADEERFAGEGLPADAGEFIKGEEEWENSFV
ncbi:hypothetical protein T440DRAFT_507742 [Plenodomus tracheiphilus IPT5]|uniref:Uncharacterized protein n=1 Tax=Plenodomus tracheiphilus IPT5 TaxID=1408161 RepID=A0A6A7B5V2_9PLEO|nr:hypothetical protein T440DRAFT_507742 [Plenodomus tracheiphilus IPT5]